MEIELRVRDVVTVELNTVFIRLPAIIESVCVVSSIAPVTPLPILALRFPFTPPILLVTVATDAVFADI